MNLNLAPSAFSEIDGFISVAAVDGDQFANKLFELGENYDYAPGGSTDSKKSMTFSTFILWSALGVCR